jgi:acyl-CoA synthetase (AMP-forming)/AMP-acid ligase II
MNAFSLFEDALQKCADRKALVGGIGRRRRDISFHDVNRQVNQVALQLVANGLHRGDRVLLAVPVSIETYIVMLAVMKAGMVAMFIDPAHSARSVAGILKAWPPHAVISTPAIMLFRFLMPELRSIPQRFVVGGSSMGAKQLSFDGAQGAEFESATRSSADSALLTFTSGSTGEPKPVLRTHGFLRQQLSILNEIADVHEDDIDYVAMPMFVLFNLANAVTSVIPAADMKRPGKADPVLLYEQMTNERVTRMVASPALLERLANHCLVKHLTLPDLRCISTGGGPVNPMLARKLNKIAAGATVRMVYGSTEAEPIASLDDRQVSIDDRSRMRQGDGLLVGRPVRGCAVRIISSVPSIPIESCSEDCFASISKEPGEIGEIVVSGKHVLRGYADRAHNVHTKIGVDGTTWHRTGDAGYFDESGRLWLVGRCSAAIEDSRGSVYPFQVEYAVRAVRGIRQAALIRLGKERVLVIETVGRDFQSDCAAAGRCISAFDIDRIIAVRRIPMDKRHDAKVDYPALHRLMNGRLSRGRFFIIGTVSSSYIAARYVLRRVSAALTAAGST